MPQSKFPIFVIIAISLILGCDASTTQKSKEIDIFVGLEGLTLEFLKNTPPKQVFEGDTFPVILMVKNKGAYTLKDDKIAIISLGVEKDYTKQVQLLQSSRVKPLSASNSIAAFNLEGKSQINPNGEEEIISYNVQAGRIDPQSEAHVSTVIATLCYPYETILSSTVCVDTDVNNLRPIKKACSNKELIFSNGQGAPVAVTKIEPQMLPLQLSTGGTISEKIKPQFLIYVENKGKGIVIKNEVVNEFCTKSDTSYENLNKVYVDAYLSDKKLKCQLEAKKDSSEPGHIKLKDNKDVIRCALEEGIDRNLDSYLSTLKVVLAYGYTQSVSATYFVQKPVG